jgi:hypothetical protein
MSSCLSDTYCPKCHDTMSIDDIRCSDVSGVCRDCTDKLKKEKQLERERLDAVPKKHRKYKTIESSESLYWHFPTLENETFDSIAIKRIINTSLNSFYESFDRTKKGVKDRLEADGFVNDMIFSLKDSSHSSYEGEELCVLISGTAWRELNEKEKAKLEARLEKERKEQLEKKKHKAEKAQTEEYKHYLRLKEKYEL